MSNNHSHDNIYSILGKLEALKPTPEEKRFALVKEIRESVEAQGSIIEGVDAVQARLARQFAEGKDEGQPGKNFAKIAKGAAERYGSKEAGERVAGAVRAKLAKQGKLEETDMEEKAPPGAKAERMVKHIKKSLSKDGHLSDKDKAIAYATTWKAHNKGQVEEETCNECGMYESKCGCDHTNEGEFMNRPAKFGVCVVGHNGGKPIKIFDTEAEAEAYAKKGVRVDGKLLQGSVRTIVGEGETTHKDGVTKHRKTDFPGYPSDDLDDSEEDENKGKRGRPRKHAKKKDTGEKKGRGRPSKHSTGEKSSKDNLPFSSKNKMGHDPFGRVKKDAEKSVAESMDKLSRRLTEGVNFANLLKEKHQTVDEMLAELSNDMKVFKETGHCSELLRDCMEIKGYHGKMMADEGSEPVQRPSNPDPFANVKDAPKPPMGIPGNLPANQIPGKAALLKGQGRSYYEEDSLASELDELAKLAGLSEVSRGEYIKQQDTAAEKSGKDKFNAFGQVFDTDEITEEPNEGNAFTAGLADDDVKIGDKIPGTNAIKTKDIDEAKVDVADAPESVNKPRPKFASIKTITTQGDDMNREKSQDPATANKAANPLTNKGSRVSEATLSLEAQLAAEYESIKKIS